MGAVTSVEVMVPTETYAPLGGIGSAFYLNRHLKDKTLDKHPLVPSSLRNNQIPIVLVHGYCGSTANECFVLGGYFHFAFDAADESIQIYEADVSPVGSTHDRACELY